MFGNTNYSLYLYTIKTKIYKQIKLLSYEHNKIDPHQRHLEHHHK